MDRLVIGTRGSPLAMWQARYVRSALRAAHPQLAVELKIIRTRGDRLLEAPLHHLGGAGKGLFTREIETALLGREVDLAVHSLKDLPTESPPGLTVAAVPIRADAADALVAKGDGGLADLPQGATVMTGSLRRAAQILHVRSDLAVVGVRGNVGTRLRKFDESAAAGIVLAVAGLTRLELADRITHRLDPREFLPACGQGALGVQVRLDGPAGEYVAAIDDPPSRRACAAERGMLAALGGGCQVPIGAHACGGDELELTGMVASLDGSKLIRRTVQARCADEPAASAVGGQLAEALLADGAREILDEIESETNP